MEQVGRKNNCEGGFPSLPSILDRVSVGTFCGVFRRQALDRGAASLGVDHIVTGHNADDIAETVLMNSEYWPSVPYADTECVVFSHAR